MQIVKGLQSEIYVPITPPPVWTPVTKALKDMKVAIASAAGIHLKSQERFNIAGDFSFREIPSASKEDDLMVTHGGYDNGDVNKDINCMFPITRMKELKAEGFIGDVAPVFIGFMGGGGNQEKFKNETGPAVAKVLKNEGVDAVVLTAGWGTCHRSAVLVQRAIEESGIPTIIIAALPPVVKQTGTPRAVAPLVPMGANAGEPNNKQMQTEILKATLNQLIAIDSPGKIVPLPFEYVAHV